MHARLARRPRVGSRSSGHRLIPCPAPARPRGRWRRAATLRPPPSPDGRGLALRRRRQRVPATGRLCRRLLLLGRALALAGPSHPSPRCAPIDGGEPGSPAGRSGGPSRKNPTHAMPWRGSRPDAERLAGHHRRDLCPKLLRGRYASERNPRWSSRVGGVPAGPSHARAESADPPIGANIPENSCSHQTTAPC